MSPSERLLEAARDVLNGAESGDYGRRVNEAAAGRAEPGRAIVSSRRRPASVGQDQGATPCPLAALDAIEKGCNVPLSDGLRAEMEAFGPLVGSPISRNLIAVFFMTQRLQKDPGVADPAVKPKDVQRVGVLGAGIMGAGIAGAHLRRGIPAMLLDNNQAAIDKGVAGIAKVMQTRIDIGRDAAEMISALGKLNTTMQLSAMNDRDVVIEAAIENEAAKTQIYRELEPQLRPDTILASNTSTISITRMAKALQRPERFAGMHFFNPVDRMQLVEVIRGEKTADVTVATLVALAKKVGKTPIVVKDCPGFLVNRILFLISTSLALLRKRAGRAKSTKPSPRHADGTTRSTTWSD